MEGYKIREGQIILKRGVVRIWCYDKLEKQLIDHGYGVRDRSHVSVAKLQDSGIIPLSSWYRMKRGYGDLDLRTIGKLCELFNCQPNDLIEWIPDFSYSDKSEY